MANRPTGEELAVRIRMLEKEVLDCKGAQEELSVVYDALNSSVSGVIITNPQGKITYVNPAFLRIFEYRDKAEVLGKNAAGLFATDDVKKFSDVQTIIDETRGETEEFEVHRKDGTTFYVEVSSSNVTDHTGRIVGRMASFVDVSDRKQVEEELRSFVRIVSHDLKTPIVAIQGFCSRLLGKHRGELGVKALTCVEYISMAASRMERLVYDLLALSKADKALTVFSEISSAEIVDSVVSQLHHKLESKDMELVVLDGLPVVCCDENSIYQVFENLVSNAIKFTGTVSHPRIEIGYRHGKERHEFYVKDNGIGIDPKDQKKIFEMFHQLKEIEDKGGTGLGLNIVERIVNRHGGKVWVESEKGCGATFYFSLPRAPDLGRKA
jgi:PAS domain S-box-containing protein